MALKISPLPLGFVLIAIASLLVAAPTTAATGGRRWLSSSLVSPTTTAFSRRSRSSPISLPSALSLRGGSSDDEEFDAEQRTALLTAKREEKTKLLSYRTEQQILYQLRATYLTEMLARRGVPLPTVQGVATTEGEKKPENVDWDCSLSTNEEPKSCLYSFDAEPNTKVVAPLGTDQWISLSALNRLRRTDPAKVEPMWHSQYSVLKGWFSDDSEHSLLQHVGFRGFFVSSVLLDGGGGWVLKSLLTLALLSILVVAMPVLEFVACRLLVSSSFWAQWPSWGRIARAGFPLKLLLGQLAWKAVASSFAKLEGEVRDRIVDMECEILEESVPLTVGPGVVEEEDEDEGGAEEGFETEEESDDYMDLDVE